MIVYFKELMQTFKPSALWSQHSMLKSTIAIYENIQIKVYKILIALLTSFSHGYEGKKAKVFTAEEV